MDFHHKYNRFINPLYGEPRNITADDELLKTNSVPHDYCVKDRVDMTKYEVYSIDPEGCEDADDAFSIYEEDGRLYLAIHIADPTEYIQLNSPLWKDIESRVVTRYPSNKPPIHLMPNEIMEKASLTVNQYGSIKMDNSIKLALTIHTEIDSTHYLPIGQIKLLFTKINVKRENALSYKKAATMSYSNDALYNGLKISQGLKEKRGNETKAVILNDLSTSYVVFNNNEPELYKDSPTERLMKQMIAEFAIFANSFIGEYLKINFKGSGLYRICPANEWLSTVDDAITGKELLNEIIMNGIKAEYMSTVASHDLVGSPEYIHFTSPIRRLSDCVCHYLLKYIHIQNSVDTSNIEVPFTSHELYNYSNICSTVSKNMKNIQYKDTKFRLIQVMNILTSLHENVTITYYVSSYKNSFFNIIINKIGNHDVYLSYTLRIPDIKKSYILKIPQTIQITKINSPGKFDQGTIPELDHLFL